MSFLDKLATTRNLWLLFAATIVITFSFPMLAQMFALSFVDAVSDPAVTRQMIEGFSAEQRTAHAWITATVDVAYPLAYGGFFAASARCFFPNMSFLVWPGLIVIPVDCLEGLVQVLALIDVVDWVDAKALLTPLKFGLFYISFGITLVGWITWVYRRVTS